MSDNLKEIHKQDILHAAIAEFGRVGYRAASTNEIVKKAGVSKGLLFHHFKCKEQLYTACQIYVLEEYGKYMLEHKDFTSPDLFKRILKNLRIKMEFGFRNPMFLGIINRAWTLENDENPLEKLEAETHVLNSMQLQADFFFEGIDSGLFREGYDIAKIMKYSRLMLEAHWKQFAGRHNNDVTVMIENMEDYFSEAEEIVELFRKGAYR